MSQERNKEHKCSHHAASPDDSASWWQKFHFSGKVIMCSVLFGFGLVLIGGLLLAIGADHHDDENNGELNEVQNKAPMSIVGPIIMGIGGFTVFVGIIMCLFETNICRKRQPDSRPLIDEQNSETGSRTSDAASIPSTSQKREKHRHHKKSSSPRRQKGGKKSEQNSNRSSPSSMPINMQRSLSKDLTASDKFLTPPSSLVNEHPKLQPTYSDAENQTSASLLKSITSSGKSWNTSTEFQTPSSSFLDSSGSFLDKNSDLGTSPDQKELSNDRLKNLKHEFVTPKNSSAEIIDDKPSSLQGAILENSNQENRDDNIKSKELNEEISVKLDVLSHEFVTPMNSYVDDPNVAAPKWNASNEDSTQFISIEADDNSEKFLKEKNSANSFDSSVHNTDAAGEVKTEDSQEDKHDHGTNGNTSPPNNDSIHPSDFESKETLYHGLKESNEISNPTSTAETDSHINDDAS